MLARYCVSLCILCELSPAFRLLARSRRSGSGDARKYCQQLQTQRVSPWAGKRPVLCLAVLQKACRKRPKASTTSKHPPPHSLRLRATSLHSHRQNHVLKYIFHSTSHYFCLYVAGSTPDGVTGMFQWHSLWPHYGLGVDSATNRNEYQEHCLGGKDGRCVGLTNLPPSCAGSLEILGASTSWSPKGLSRPVKGIALPLRMRFYNNFGIHFSFVST
jgi:hypothetical protein